jgi:hypothetical protein
MFGSPEQDAPATPAQFPIVRTENHVTYTEGAY